MLRRMTETRQRLGRAAEDLVAERLAATAWELLERNARTRHGELDIVALDGRTLVFVEVKAGHAGSLHGPERGSSAASAASQPPGWASATTCRATKGSASTRSASPMTAPAE